MLSRKGRMKTSEQTLPGSLSQVTDFLLLDRALFSCIAPISLRKRPFEPSVSRTVTE